MTDIKALEERIKELEVRAEASEDRNRRLLQVLEKMATTAANTEALLFTFPEAGALLHLGRTRVFQLVKAGRLKAVQIGDGGRMIRRCDLEAFVAECAYR